MGWAGLAQPTGPDSAQNGLGRFRPKKLISPSGPGPAQKAGPGKDPPGPATKTGGGNYFPPHPCMQNAIRSTCREEKK